MYLLDCTTPESSEVINLEELLEYSFKNELFYFQHQLRTDQPLVMEP